ncbi:MAG: transposase, partial [Anaerolineales bacterium]
MPTGQCRWAIRPTGPSPWRFGFQLWARCAVIGFENQELTGTYALLVSNRVEWTAYRIIATYLQRWPIETFYRDGKEHLGFDEYRMRDAKAIQKHWCLVFVAYSLLHLDCLPASLKQSHTPI